MGYAGTSTRRSLDRGKGEKQARRQGELQGEGGEKKEEREERKTFRPGNGMRDEPFWDFLKACIGAES